MRRVLKSIQRGVFKETYYEKLDQTKVVFNLESIKTNQQFDIEIKLLESINPRSAENFI
jgi:hypothetical protein